MDLDFSEEQILLRDTVRELCGKHVSLDTVRALENDPAEYPAEFWRHYEAVAGHKAGCEERESFSCSC